MTRRARQARPDPDRGHDRERDHGDHDGARVAHDLEHVGRRAHVREVSSSATTSSAWRWRAWSPTSRPRTCRATRTRRRRTRARCSSRRPGSKLPEIRFSTLGHRVLWADANESEQTVIQYLASQQPREAGRGRLGAREQRRPSNKPPEDEPAEYDVARPRHRVSVKLEFWNWKNARVAGHLGHHPVRRPEGLAAEPRADHAHRQGPGRPRLSSCPPRRGSCMQEPLNFVQ